MRLLVSIQLCDSVKRLRQTSIDMLQSTEFSSPNGWSYVVLIKMSRYADVLNHALNVARAVAPLGN